VKAIAAKLSQVGKAIGWGVPKNGRNQTQGYDYTSAASVRMAVGPALAERGIAVSSAIEVLGRESYPNTKGNRQNHVAIRVTLTFVDSATGETLSAQGLGEGVDSGDKASAKAMTMAEKYCYVSAFTLAMGEDPEQDEPPKKQRDERLGDEEHARSERQADQRADAIAAGKAMADELTTITSRADMLGWVRRNVATYDAFPIKPDLRAKVWSRLVAHVEKIQDIGITIDEIKQEMRRVREELAEASR
jgi:hypothetical protein